MAVTAEVATTEPRRITVLGSTGSIGVNTLDIVERQRENYVVEALTANNNVKLLAEQARRVRPKMAVVADTGGYRDLKAALSGTGIEVEAGAEALVESASRPVDWMMAGIVGAAGLAPTLAGVRQGAVVGLANKECLVCAGDLFMREIEKCGATLLPVDSEHNAIFQCFDFEQSERVRRVMLTASGGPFRTRLLEEMSSVTPEEAVAHPNWDMGAKISVDSATMMNKGLEVIEAYHLFPVTKEQIEIAVHPQSVVHSLVEYVDGSVLAQLGSPDMRTPIAYALGWPHRMEAPVPRLDLFEIGALTFEKPDPRRFPALRTARDALYAGDSAPTVLNAANEIAVRGFLDRKIGFLDIVKIVEKTLEKVSQIYISDLSAVHEKDNEARRVAKELMKRVN